MSQNKEDIPVQEDPADDKEVSTAGKGLSAAQKKKLKAKAKKEEEKVAAVTAIPEDDNDEPAGAGGKAKKGKKGAAGPRNAIAKLAQEKIRLKQEEEERIRKEEEEIKRKEEEEERLRKEEEERIRKEEEAKRREKKAWKQELKDKGQWVSKKEKAKQDEARAKRQQLIDQGVIRPDEPEANDTAKKSQIVKPKKNKKKDLPKPTEEEAKIEEPDQKEDLVPALQPKREPVQEGKRETNTTQVEDDVVDDWENADEDDLAAKIVSKEINPSAGGKLRKDDEEADDHDAQKQQKQSKQTMKIKQAVKQSREEEKFQGGDLFAAAMEAQSSSAQRAQKLAEHKAKQEARKQEVLKSQQQKKQHVPLRSPILCILGHVDTGKTLILDKLRRTNVQAGEAGGITQQIGATYFPESAIREHLAKMKGRLEYDLQVPGFQVIDTPGHESFTNLRSRGSNLCDFAILVVDIMHGLEKQTLESLQLLRNKKTPFVVALNKIDRIYQWKSKPFNNVRDSLEAQEPSARAEFKDRLEKAKLAFAEQGINAELYWDNKDPQSYVSLVPTSAITGEGLPDLVSFIAYLCQTNFAKKLKEKEEFECSVLEVKVIEGLGHTIDVILVNGKLTVGDTIILAGFNGPIVTTIRALLTPQPMREMRVKAEYIHHESIKGSMGIKISAPGFENAMAGSELYRADTDEEIEQFKIQIADDLVDIMNKYVDKTHNGVCVQASTIGSLEALLEFLKTMKIPVTSINIGPVFKKDIIKAMKSLQGEHQMKEYATILAFDVKVMPDAQTYADDNGITIFTANIIYHLFDQFTEYVKKCQEERKTEEGVKAVFPALLEMVKGACFHANKPVVIGVTVKAGILKVGTPLCIPEKGNMKLGRIESIESNGKPLLAAKPTHGAVAIKITGDDQLTYGRHFDDSNQIASIVTRDSIDALKKYFKDDLTKDDWKLVIQLKQMFGIP